MEYTSTIFDAFLSAAISKLPVPDAGSVFDDILMQASNLAKFLYSPEGKVINEFIAGGQFDPKLAEEYRLWYFRPRRLESRRILERGIQRGEIKKDLDLELCIDLLYGPLFYRLLVTGETVDGAVLKVLIQYAFEGILVGKIGSSHMGFSPVAHNL